MKAFYTILVFAVPLAASLSINSKIFGNQMASIFANIESKIDSEPTRPDPPPHTEPAKLARYIIHYSDWASMATISTRKPTVGFPFSNLFSISDGSKPEVASGVPYFYFTDMEMSVQDLNEDNRATISMTLAQSGYCKNSGLDPQDPPCGRLILSGRTYRVANGTEEEAFARDALFTRHPGMSDYPTGHLFYFAKLEIEEVILLAFFGGATHIPVNEYFAAGPPGIIEEQPFNF